MPIRRAGALVALALSLAACGLGEREGFAREIEGASRRAAESGTAVGTLGIGFELDVSSLPPDAREQALEANAQATGDPVVTYDVVVDLDRRRAAYLVDGTPKVVFDDLEVYGTRHDAIPEEARPWVLVDLRDIDDEESPVDPQREGPVAGIEAVNPAVLLDLAAGPLTGSIERIGREDGLTGYRANFDLDKALTDVGRRRYDDEHLEPTQLVLDLLGTAGTMHPGEVWLDDEGRARRFRIEIKRANEFGFSFIMVLHLELERWGERFDVPTPADDALLQVDGFKQFLRAVVPPLERRGPAAP